MRVRGLGVLAALSLALPAAPAVARQVHAFNQPASTLGEALRRAADRAGRTLVFEPDTVKGRSAPGLDGALTFESALSRLLEGTGLVIEESDGVVVIRRAAVPVLVDDVVVTGSRGPPRTGRDSPVPIDVLNRNAIRRTGYIDTNDVLRTLAPSYSVNREPNSDAGTFVRPATLRGLPGDKTLLLVNSKRRHRSAAVGASGFGAQSADAATIPASSVRAIEMLRDGAAAQYGSDAVAGVINFLLREDASGGAMSARVGEFHEGDGEDYFLSGNLGLPLTAAGFLNVSAEYNKAGSTSRGGPYCNAIFCAADHAAENPAYAALVDAARPMSKIGQPALEAVRGFVNAGVELNDDTRLYGFASYSRSNAAADGTYRYPTAGQTTTDVPVRLPDGSPFRFSELFPGGFTPRYSAVITDHSVTSGVRGVFDLGHGLSYDFSARYGENQMKYRIENTVNPSLGPLSPRAFMRAIYLADETAFNADFTYGRTALGLAAPLTTAFGFEYRHEGFEMRPGEPSAYAVGPYGAPDPWGFCGEGATVPEGVDCADPDDPVYNSLPTLTLTVSPDIAGRLSRESSAAYLEVSADVTDRLFIDAAVRYETYSDFGETLNGKLAARFRVNDAIGLRGSVGTGFRAPTPGQQSFSNIQLTSSDGTIVMVGLLPVSNPVARFLGAEDLRPEDALNLAAGVAIQLAGGISLDLDVYRIAVKDQFYTTSQIAITPVLRQAMIDAGVAGAETIDRVQFFQNALDTTVSGLDIVATDEWIWGGGHHTDLTFTLNYNRYEIDRVLIAGLLDDEAVFDFENGRPDWRANLTGVHGFGPLALTVRARAWGPYENMFSASNRVVQAFDPEIMFDVEVAYRIDERREFTIGARNIFDNYPARDRIGETTANGAIYRTDSAVDWQGGFVFARLDMRF